MIIIFLNDQDYFYLASFDIVFILPSLTVPNKENKNQKNCWTSSEASQYCHSWKALCCNVVFLSFLWITQCNILFYLCNNDYVGCRFKCFVTLGMRCSDHFTLRNYKIQVFFLTDFKTRPSISQSWMIKIQTSTIGKGKTRYKHSIMFKKIVTYFSYSQPFTVSLLK